MANATPAASCPSCSYTPLAIATSTFSFLTFLYALTVGLIYYYGLAKSSPEETDKFIEAVFKTLTELNEAVHQMTDEEPAAQQVEEEITRKMTKDIHALGAKVIEQRDSLYGFRGRFGSLDESQGFIITSSPGGQGITKAYFVSKPGSWLPGSRSLISSRIRYLITRKELQRKVEETDRLMTEIRFLQQRSVSIFPILLRVRP